MMTKFITLLNNNIWTFAKTMPEIPHYYLVRENLSDKDQILFDEFNKFINEKGYVKSFFDKEYVYFNFEGYKYWFIKNILNREKLK